MKINSQVEHTPGIKYQLRLTILIFWEKFPQEWYFRSKTKNLNITVEFRIFELA